MYKNNIIIYMNEVNLAEFIYNYISKVGKDIVISRHRYIRNSPIKIISPNENITEAILKSKPSLPKNESLAHSRCGNDEGLNFFLFKSFLVILTTFLLTQWDCRMSNYRHLLIGT